MAVVAFALGILLGFVGSIPAAGPLLLLVIASGLEGQRRRALALAAGGALAESSSSAPAKRPSQGEFTTRCATPTELRPRPAVGSRARPGRRD
jgi:hypothetical protein